MSDVQLRNSVFLASGLNLTAAVFAALVGAQDAPTPESLDGSSGRSSLGLSVEGDQGAAKSVVVNLAADGGGNTITGSATVVGFPTILDGSFGLVDWRVDGSTVSGKLIDPSGQEAGTFNGTVTPTGVSGQYTTADGRTGLWSWDGPVPGEAK
jgi:hypothetical protein